MVAMSATVNNPELIFNPSQLERQAEVLAFMLGQQEFLDSSNDLACRLVSYGKNPARDTTFDWYTRRSTKITLTVERRDVSTSGGVITMYPVVSNFELKKIHGRTNNPVSDEECNRMNREISLLFGVGP